MPEKQGWSGRSDETILPQLSAEFWKVGKIISGKFSGGRETVFYDKETKARREGTAYRLTLNKAITLNNEEVTLVEIPSLTGFTAAVQALVKKGYSPIEGDIWEVKCVEIKKATRADFSNSPQFEISVIRPKF